MRSFNVLSRELLVNASYFIEASAGTGKTFAIEHLFVRYLLEGEVSIEQILVVTFTRAAARELRARIHATLAQARRALSDGCPAPHDYLRALQEGGEELLRPAIRRLESGLALFDEASIGTIHSFCLRALREYGLEAEMGIDLRLLEEAFDPIEQRRFVRDFLRVQKGVSGGQLERLINDHRGDLKEVERLLLKSALSSSPGQPARPLSDLFDHFLREMENLVATAVEPERLRSMFLLAAPNYRDVCDRSGKVKEEVVERLDRFLLLLQKRKWSLSDFDQLIEDGIVVTEALDPAKIKSGREFVRIEEVERIASGLAPIVEEGRDPARIFDRLLNDCAGHLHTYLDKEEVATPDRLLEWMRRGLDRPQFKEQLQRHYRIAIIDEFQDTDPVQWQIFSTLFERLVLVGDPKQSIYAFRKADIYCYLNAMESVESSYRCSLQTNYRALPELLDATNALFAGSASPGLFALPRANRSLVAPSCLAGVAPDREAGWLQFIILSGTQGRSKKWPTAEMESDQLFPFIARELAHLDTPLERCAILVRDWDQGERIRQSLSQWRIPAASWRKLSPSQSEGYRAWQAVLEAALFPHNLDAIKRALVSSAIGWTTVQLKSLAGGESIAQSLAQFALLGQILHEKGAYPFFDALMGSSFGRTQLLPSLLRRSGGKALYLQMRQIACRLAEEQARTGYSGLELAHWLATWEWVDQELPPIVEEGAVQILTIHASKGLEFDVVFALGVASRTFIDEENGEEVDAEKARQLYVALTRARKRLYVPVAIEESGRSVPSGAAAPIELLLTRLGESEQSYSEMLEAIPRLTVKRVEEQLRALHCPSLRWTYIQKELSPPPVYRPPLSSSLPSPAPLPPFQRRLLHSFTTLSKRGNASVFEGDREGELPAGAEVGSLLHKLFEEIDLSYAGQAESAALLIPWVAERISSTCLEGWEERVSSLLWCSMHTSLGPFTLADINPSKVWREAEFYHPIEGGAMVGVVDLFFEHEGRYYLVDWKSNRLNSYEQESLRKEMEANDYFLQANLYQEALRRLLSSCDQRPFSEAFGGIYYLFVRGLRPDIGAAEGVYCIEEQSCTVV